MSSTIKKIGDFVLSWGESLCWDDRQNRLYFVDCVKKTLHWLDNIEPPLQTLVLPSMATGLGLVEDGRLIVALDKGLFLIDPDNSSIELLTPYPDALGPRANDATIDREGNFITGSLKQPNTGTYWWYSSKHGWRQLAEGISNANGPVVIPKAKGDLLVFADSPAQKLYSYDYDAVEGKVGERQIFADTSFLGGPPDGACATADGSVLSCIIGKGCLAQYTEQDLQQVIEAGSEQPSDVTFAGPNLDRLFAVSITLDFGHGEPKSPLAGSLVEIENTGLQGCTENRFRL